MFWLPKHFKANLLYNAGTMFHLFCSENYYPLGGGSDYQGSFEDLEDAKASASLAVATIMQTVEGGALKLLLCGDRYEDEPWIWEGPHDDESAERGST